MNRNRLLLIGICALGLGLFVSVAVYNNMKAKIQPGTSAGVPVVVAARTIPVGSRLQETDVKVVSLPGDSLPPGRVSQKSDVVGQGVILPIGEGEFILPNKLAGKNAGAGLPALIPPGMRAVSVRVNEVVAVAGYVMPGTRVDVLLTGNPTGASDQQTITVLENVAVLASGQRLERNASGDPETAPVITLLVSPDDAQKLTLASTQGRIQLSLRNPLDNREQDLHPVSANALYRGGAAPPPVAPKRSAGPRKPAPVALPSVYAVEVIRGDKKEETKF